MRVLPYSCLFSSIFLEADYSRHNVWDNPRQPHNPQNMFDAQHNTRVALFFSLHRILRCAFAGLRDRDRLPFTLSGDLSRGACCYLLIEFNACVS